MEHSAQDCYHRNTTTSAYKSVPCTKQSTEENKQFRRDFRQNNHRGYTTNELTHTGEEMINDNDEIERHDDVEDPKKLLPRHPPQTYKSALLNQQQQTTPQT